MEAPLAAVAAAVPPPSGTEQTGTFVDSPVQGLTYVTTSGTGITNGKGEFTYKEGEEIFFLVGNTELGQSFASKVITPLDISGDAQNSDKSTNILRFLQTLDEDGDPTNGITISENVLVLENTQTTKVNFDVSTENFAVQPAVTALINEAGQSDLVTVENALAHFDDTLRKLPDSSIDIKGKWIASSVYKYNESVCVSEATYTFTETGWSVAGEELNPDTEGETIIDCGNTVLKASGSYDNVEFASDPGMGCEAGICTFNQLNRIIPKWDREETTDSYDERTLIGESYSKVELSHTRGSDIMRRVRTEVAESTFVDTGESFKNVYGVSETTFLRKEAHDYVKDMRGTCGVFQVSWHCFFV